MTVDRVICLTGRQDPLILDGAWNVLSCSIENGKRIEVFWIVYENSPSYDHLYARYAHFSLGSNDVNAYDHVETRYAGGDDLNEERRIDDQS